MTALSGIRIQEDTPVNGQSFKEKHGNKKFPKVATIGLMVLGNLGIFFGLLSIAGGIVCAASGYGAPAAAVLIPVGALALLTGIAALTLGIVMEDKRQNEIRRQKYNSETNENKMDTNDAIDMVNEPEAVFIEF